MSLAPLLDAAPAIPLHAFAAMAAFVLGLLQFASPKGTLPHRTVGWIWVALMLVVAISALWIHQIRLLGPFSPIHFLSIFTLVMLPLAVWKAHSPSGRGASPDHDQSVSWRAFDRRPAHAPSRTDHAQGGFRRLKRRFSGRWKSACPRPVAKSVSLCKNERKNIRLWTVKDGFLAPDGLYDSQERPPGSPIGR